MWAGWEWTEWVPSWRVRMWDGSRVWIDGLQWCKRSDEIWPRRGRRSDGGRSVSSNFRTRFDPTWDEMNEVGLTVI